MGDFVRVKLNEGLSARILLIPESISTLSGTNYIRGALKELVMAVVVTFSSTRLIPSVETQ